MLSVSSLFDVRYELSSTSFHKNVLFFQKSLHFVFLRILKSLGSVTFCGSPPQGRPQFYREVSSTRRWMTSIKFRRIDHDMTHIPLKNHVFLLIVIVTGLNLTAGCQQGSSLIDPVSEIDGTAERIIAGTDGQIRHQPIGFQEALRDYAETPVIVDFWASWCGPCRMLTPELERVAAQLGDKVVVLKVNVDTEIEMSRHFDISAIPALRVFQRGRAVASLTGFHTAAEIVEKLP